MKLTINDQLISPDFRKKGTPQELEEVIYNFHKTNEVVQEVIIDGITYHDGYEERLTSEFFDIKEVTIRTINRNELAEEIYNELNAYLLKLITACDSISELFYGELKQENWNHFSQLMNGIQWVVQSVDVLKVHYNQYNGSIEQNALDGFTQQIESQIRTIEQELQVQNYTALGDIIKYELSEVFKQLANSLTREVN